MIAEEPTWRTEIVEVTGSTNADLMAAAAAGAPHRSVLCARHQTAGRGRLDRSWEAPDGANLLVSLLFRDELEHPHRLTQRVAVAAAEAAEQVAGWRPGAVGIKWPNDLLLGNAKLAGILAQAGGAPGRIDYVVVGLGLNVRWAPEGAACLGETSDPMTVLDELLRVLDGLGHGHDERYRERLVTLGQRVRVTTPEGDLMGLAVDVLADGRLVVRPDGGGPDRRLAIGDVIHLRAVAD